MTTVCVGGFRRAVLLAVTKAMPTPYQLTVGWPLDRVSRESLRAAQHVITPVPVTALL